MAIPGPYMGVPQFGQGAFDHQFVPPANVIPLPVRKQKHLTCRYWLYAGGGCPDLDEFCPFAHEDTGVLSEHRDQRGTCYHWKMTQKGCRLSANKCEYEHRDTGVLNNVYPMRGNDRAWHRHKLTGINLAIANAAEMSGFNVGNKKALMELVFAVRRAGGLGDNYRPAPPAHPIYPDRYRPREKRKRGHFEENTVVVGHLGSHPVLSGSRTHPIDLDGDENTGNGHVMAANSSAKRQRTQQNVHPDRLILKDMDQTLDYDDDNRSRCPPSPPHTRQARSQIAFNDNISHEDTMSVMRTVSNTLAENEQANLKCADAMRKLWEKDKRIQHQGMIQILQELKQCLELGGNAAAEGVKTMTLLMRRIRDGEVR